MEVNMGDENQVSKDDVQSDTPKAQDVSKEPQQLTGLSKPQSYGTTRMVNARDNTSDSDTEKLFGAVEGETNE
jgi:hypothetical protein